MLNIGECIQIEQALTEVTLNHEPFPDCLVHNSFWKNRRSSDGMWATWKPNPGKEGSICVWATWDDLPITERVGIVAVALSHIRTGPAAIIHRAYLKLCTGT